MMSLHEILNVCDVDMKSIPGVYVIGDTHFGHEKMLSYCGRPGNFNELIVERWLEVIPQDAVVIVLGDAIIYYKDYSETFLKLTGHKILIRGNHDCKSESWYLRHGFCFVTDKLQYGGVVFSHVPLPVDEVGAFINVHAHFHNASPSRWEEKYTKRITPKHWLYSLEYVDYYPVPMKGFVITACQSAYGIMKAGDPAYQSEHIEENIDERTTQHKVQT